MHFSSDLDTWTKIVEIIGNKRPFQGSIFYRIIRLYEPSSGENLQITQFAGDELERGYVIKGGKRYIIEIGFDFGKEPPKEASMDNITLDSLDLIKIMPSYKRLGFRKDKTKFSLLTEKTFWNQFTYITTKIENSIEGPSLELPFKIERTFEAYLFGFMVLAGLILVTGITDNFGLFFSQNTYTLKLIGTFLTTTGTWLLTGYKR